MNYPYYYGDSFGFWGFLWHLIGIVIAIWVITMILRAIFGCRGYGGGRRWRRHMAWHALPALEVLEERFAKGEISKEEFEERRKTLMGE